jgi:cation transport ATPase
VVHAGLARQLSRLRGAAARPVVMVGDGISDEPALAAQR